MNNLRMILLSGVEGIALIFGIFVWDLEPWIPVLLALFATGFALKGFSIGGIFFGSNLVLGAIFGYLIFESPPQWTFSLLGVVAVGLIGMHLSTPRTGGEASAIGGSGDQNPIPILVMVIGMRAWLAFFDASATALGENATNPLNWLTIVVLGINPNYPILVNVLLAILTNGSLILWLVLLNKRIVNPLAN